MISVPNFSNGQVNEVLDDVPRQAQVDATWTWAVH